MDTLNLAIGLIILIIVNIVLGSLDALFTSTFDKTKFKLGLLKGLVAVACFMATYFVGYLNPDIVAVNINGTAVNVLVGVYLIVMAAYIWYAKEVLTKLSTLIKAKITIAETGEAVNIEEVEETPVVESTVEEIAEEVKE
jgi:hypothetical protein